MIMLGGWTAQPLETLGKFGNAPDDLNGL